MKFKRQRLVITALILLLICPGMQAQAQEKPSWRVELQLGEGTWVRTGIGTVPPNVLDLDSAYSRISGVGYIGQKQPGGGVIRRILKLADGRAIVYEVALKRIDNGKRFVVDLRPVTPTPQEAAQWGIDPGRIETEFLRSYSSPLTIKDGDILALDVLVEPRSGAKFVDYYLVSDGPAAIRRDSADNLLAKARQFKVEDVELPIDGYELWRNGVSIHRNEQSETRGRFIWLDIPEVGRVIFTLTPAEGIGFHPSAMLSGNRILFSIGADQYEWLSKRLIAPGSGVYQLWMRYDQTFSFPARSRKPDQAVAGWQIGSAADVVEERKKN